MESTPEQEQVACTSAGAAKEQSVGTTADKHICVKAQPAENELPDMENKTEDLIAFTNKTFQDLCKSLEVEHNKLVDLEERRKKLYDEMQQLKADIEAEKNSFRMMAPEGDSAGSADGVTSMEYATDTDEETTGAFLKRQETDLASELRGSNATDEHGVGRTTPPNETAKRQETTSSMAGDI